MKVFVKPNGVEIEVNESSEAHALALGWKEKTPELQEPVEESAVEAGDDLPADAPKRRGRPPKVS